jgi:hypothetical protein
MNSSLGKTFGIFGNPVAWEKTLIFFSFESTRSKVPKDFFFFRIS